jgi:uncharacterized protein YkwD
MNGIVAAHNRVRAKHCAPPITWSAQIAAVAQKWADSLAARNCAFQHSPNRKYGENLFGGTGQLTPAQTVGSWYSEVKHYDFGKPGFNMRTGHFTQVVWARSTQLGCGLSRCSNGMSIVVCNYSPAGNFQGRYRQNVKPTGCKP